MKKKVFALILLFTVGLSLPGVSVAAERYNEPRVPERYIELEQVKVKWDSDSKVKKFRLRLYKGTETKKIVHTYKQLQDKTHKDITKDLEPNTTYAVRLKAFYKDGTESRYSPKVKFTTAQVPNVILIVSDDQRYDTTAHMPNLLALAAEGTTFTDGYVTTPLCCPSRSSILSGQYAHNHGVLGNSNPYGFTAFEDSHTLATWLHDAGYKTGLVGKYLNGYSVSSGVYVPPGWDTFNVFGTGVSFQNYLLTEYNDGVLSDSTEYGDDDNDYSTTVLTDKALTFIENTEGDDDQPFFLYWTPYAPHAPMTPEAQYQNSFDDLAAYDAPSLNEGDVSDKTGFVKDLDLLTEGELIAIENVRQKTYESLLSIDDGIADVKAQLEALGELDNTIIIYMGDNGYHWGEHRIRAGKSTPYEESVHVPYFFYDGRNPAGQTIDEPVLNIDLAPTILDYALVEKSDMIDGQSMVELIEGTQSDWRTDFLTESWTDSENADPFTSLHSESLVYIAYESGAEELYDLSIDPYQENNVSANAAYAAQLAEFRTRTAALATCVGATACQ